MSLSNPLANRLDIALATVANSIPDPRLSMIANGVRRHMRKHPMGEDEIRAGLAWLKSMVDAVLNDSAAPVVPLAAEDEASDTGSIPPPTVSDAVPDYGFDADTIDRAIGEDGESLDAILSRFVEPFAPEPEGAST